MKERPITFTDAQVRGILAGRMTQTRRIAKPPPTGVWNVARCPYGQPGDHLWVREAWKEVPPETLDLDVVIHRPSTAPGRIVVYRASGPEHLRWRPSIHMPRWASRLTLEIEGVRVERLQQITGEDARAEGIEPLGPIGCPCEGEADDPGLHLVGCRWGDIDIDPDEEPHRAAYRVFWVEVSGARHPWAANPWVWVLEFRRVDT